MKKFLIFTALLLTVASVSWAYDYDFKTGGLCYKIISGTNTVRVTYEVWSQPSYNNLSGAITIPQTVKNGNKTYTVVGIDNSTFHECHDITSVSIPNTVQSIGWNAFDHCIAMTSVNIPDGITVIKENTFDGCSSLKSIVIPNTVTKIYELAFRWCESLESVTMSDNVTSFGNFAFGGCSSLKSIRIPSGVTKISQSAFFCTSLDTIFCEVQDPSQVEISMWAFSNVNTQTCLLVVPEGTVEAYREAAVWKDFVNIVDHLDPAPEPEPEPEPVEVTLTPTEANTPHNDADQNIEGYDKLFDKNKSTKWCVVNSSGAWETIWVDFKSNVAFIPDSYIFTTGNDTYYFTGRNPKAWKIYAKAKENDQWTTIVDVSDGAALGLGTSNTTDYSFNVNGVDAKYQYFRFEVSEIRGKDGWDPNNYVFQLAEFQFMAKAAGGATILGDIDDSGIIDVEDVNAAINIILKVKNINDYPGDGDMDGNGFIDVEDVNKIINIILKLD